MIYRVGQRESGGAGYTVGQRWGHFQYAVGDREMRADGIDVEAERRRIRGTQTGMSRPFRISMRTQQDH